MPVAPGFATYCAELLAPLGTVRTKPMFGGFGIYVDELFVAIVVGDALYLKTNAATAPKFAAAGGTRFTYDRQGAERSAGYWTVPPEAMDSPATMLPWGRMAVQAATQARAAVPGRRAARG